MILLAAAAIAALARLAATLSPVFAQDAAARTLANTLPIAQPPSGPAASALAPWDAPLPRASIRDPFAPRARAIGLAPQGAGPRETFHVSALWTENGVTLALINGKILGAGDVLGLITIESASADGLWVVHGPDRDFLVVGQTLVVGAPAPQEHTG